MNFEDKAYQFAAAFQGVKTKGSTPTVKYLKEMQFAGKPIIGKYRSYRIPIVKWVIWDRIWVLKSLTSAQQWANLCHEMSHALDARQGRDKSETKAEACERAAYEAGIPA